MTERLVLRPFTEDDLEPYRSILNAPEVAASLDLSGELSVDEVWQRLAMYAGQWELRGSGVWAVVEAESGVLIGHTSVHNPVREGWPGTEIGWTLHPEVWGHGFATEAGAVAIQYAWQMLGLHRVYSVIDRENARSQAVAQRLGFALTGYRTIAAMPDAGELGIWQLEQET